MVKDPPKGLGQHIGRIDNAWDVMEDNIAECAPVLKAKITDLDVTRSISGATMIDNLDRRIVVFVDRCSRRLGETKLCKDKAEVFGDFGCRVGRNKFSLSGALGSNGLSFGAIGNCSASKTAGISTSGAALTKFIAMGSIHKGD